MPKWKHPRSLRRIVLSLAAIATFFVAVVTAAIADDPSPPPGHATPAVKPSPSTGLLGDFGGARSALVQQGFTFGGHVVSEFAGNATGGVPIGGNAQQRGTALSTEVGVDFDADLGKLSHSGAGIVHVLVTTRFGTGLSSTTLGALGSVQEIYGDGQTTRFTYLDYEQPLFNKKLNVLIGKINQQNDFIAGPTYWGGNLYCYYQNNDICGTPAAIPQNNGIVPAGSEGYGYYPSSQWGGRLKLAPSKNFYIEAAAIQSNPIVNTNHGGAYFGFNGATGTELPVEVGVTLTNAGGDPVGDVRVGGYYDTSNVANFRARELQYAIANDANNAAALASIPMGDVRGRSGTDIQLDHLIEGSSLPGKGGTTLFVSAEYSDPNTSLISSFVDAGLVRHGTFPKRTNDTLALGFAVENYNPRLQNEQLALQSAGYRVPFNGSERAFEINYGFQARPWLLLRPGAQYVLNPEGEQTNVPSGFLPTKSALVYGLTSVITF